MEKLTLYIKESYHELVENVTWPTWSELITNTIVVLVATVVFALIIWIMDTFSNQVVSFLYGIG
jgi:preprotein translocase subunit SecE